MGGGDLLNLLIEQDVFEEDFTRFYIAEVTTYGTFLRISQLIVASRWYLPWRPAINSGSFTVT